MDSIGRSVDFVEHTDAAVLLPRVAPILNADPITHTTLLSLLTARAGGTVGGDRPLLIELTRDGSTVGAVYWEAPWPMLLSAVPPSSIPALVNHLHHRSVPVGAVMGPTARVDGFARLWTDRTARAVNHQEDMRLYRLGELTFPTGVPGSARAVTPGDEEVVTGMLRGFVRDTGIRPGEDADLIARQTWNGDRVLTVWEDDDMVVSLAGATPVATGMSRVGFVYTSPARRGRGYAAAVTAVSSRQALDRGARDVVLYANAADPVPNRVYSRIGYRPVGDVRELRFSGDA